VVPIKTQDLVKYKSGVCHLKTQLIACVIDVSGRRMDYERGTLME